MRQHSPPFVLWVLCLDDEVVRVLTSLQLEGVRLVRLADLERSCPALLEVKNGRLLLEYYWTCGPAFLLHIFESAPDVELLTYVDADVYFFSSPAPLYEELGGNSILLIEHRGKWDKDDTRKIGRFNLGLLVLRRSHTSLACLRQWSAQCIEWCFDRFEEGRFGDQSYLDAWPAQFPDLTVLTHEGAGLAPWNVLATRFRVEQGHLLGNDVPVIAYHFSQVRRINRWLYELHDWRFHRHRLPDVAREYLYAPYIRAIYSAERIVTRLGAGVEAGPAEERSAAQRETRRRLATTSQLGPLVRSRRFMMVTTFGTI
jgi:hypothetical protein